MHASDQAPLLRRLHRRRRRLLLQLGPAQRRPLAAPPRPQPWPLCRSPTRQQWQGPAGVLRALHRQVAAVQAAAAPPQARWTSSMRAAAALQPPPHPHPVASQRCVLLVTRFHRQASSGARGLFEGAMDGWPALQATIS